jgi:arabinofuranosyltransferase
MLGRALPDSSPLRVIVAHRFHLLLAGAAVLLAFAMVRSAWLSDDGLITYRTLDHFVNGDGLRFNLAERVQAYTHPLWLFVLAPVYALTREAFFGPLAVSLLVSGLAVGVVVARPVREGRPGVAAAALLCLVSSKAFVDYTTSGLETPLSYLLAAVWLHLYLAAVESGYTQADVLARRIGWLFALASLAFLNRMDSVLLFLPGLAAAFGALLRTGTPARRLLPMLGLAVSPALAWLAFSVLYYGTPFANTFYAKLGTGIDPVLLREQGLFYLGHALRFDPVTFLLIALGLAVALLDAVLRRRLEAFAVALGIGLQLFYVVEIGGDFMAGRFLALPFLASVLLISRIHWPSRAFGAAALACGALSLTNPLSPLRAGSDYENRDEARVIADRGISDERGFYYARRGLLSPTREAELVAGAHCTEAARPEDRIVIRSVCGELGYESFTGCRDTFLADRCALSDALLARMPMIDTTHWRVGHYFRRVPKGYRESLERDENLLVLPLHRALYDDIRLATRAPLFADGRLAAIVRLNAASLSVQRPALAAPEGALPEEAPPEDAQPR